MPRQLQQGFFDRPKRTDKQQNLSLTLFHTHITCQGPVEEKGVYKPEEAVI